MNTWCFVGRLSGRIANQRTTLRFLLNKIRFFGESSTDACRRRGDNAETKSGLCFRHDELTSEKLQRLSNLDFSQIMRDLVEPKASDDQMRKLEIMQHFRQFRSNWLNKEFACFPRRGAQIHDMPLLLHVDKCQ
jgi:hypothetical protein